jgi:bacillopeptidase F
MKENSPQSFLLPGVIVAAALIIIGSSITILTQKKNKPDINNKENAKSQTEQSAENSAPSLEPEIETTSLDDNQAQLVIADPKTNITTSLPNYTIAGKTSKNAEITVNNQNLDADGQGNFSVKVSLDEGDNYFLISAVDENGNSSEQEVMITYQNQS